MRKRPSTLPLTLERRTHERYGMETDRPLQGAVELCGPCGHVRHLRGQYPERCCAISLADRQRHLCAARRCSQGRSFKVIRFPWCIVAFAFLGACANVAPPQVDPAVVAKINYVCAYSGEFQLVAGGAS